MHAALGTSGVPSAFLNSASLTGWNSMSKLRHCDGADEEHVPRLFAYSAPSAASPSSSSMAIPWMKVAMRNASCVGIDAM